MVENNGTISGILPLVVKQGRTKIGSLNYLTYPMDHWGSFYGPIGSSPDEVLSESLAYLGTTGFGADVLELRWLGGGLGECDRFEQLLKAANYSPQRSDYDSTAVIDLSGSWEDYLASRGSKWRNNFRRWERQLNSLGEITYFRYRPEEAEEVDPVWEYYKECLRIASVSWQGASLIGTTLTHVEVASFL